MAPKTQKALIIPVEKEPVKLVTDWPVPQPGPTDVLVKLLSVALNPADAYIQAFGGGPLVPGYPFINGLDGAGVIEEVGTSVTNVTKGDKVLMKGRFDNLYATFQEYALSPADNVAKIPDNISFDQAGSVPLCLATVATGIWAHEDGANSVRFTPPWKDDGATKYAGQAALILGGSSSVGQYAIQCARMQGFSPIITTSSLTHEEYLKSLGATHVLDRRTLSYDEIQAALPALAPGKPIQYVYDAIGRACDNQRLGFSVLAPGGAFVTVNPRNFEFLADLIEESERKGEGKRVARPIASFHLPGNQKLGAEIFSRLSGWLKTGVIVPNRIEVLPNGLAGIADGAKRMLKGEVSGVKLVVRVAETP